MEQSKKAAINIIAHNLLDEIRSFDREGLDSLSIEMINILESKTRESLVNADVDELVALQKK